MKQFMKLTTDVVCAIAAGALGGLAMRWFTHKMLDGVEPRKSR